MTRHIGMVVLLAVAASASPALAQDCVGCHEKVTPQIVIDWKLSRHAGMEIGCGTGTVPRASEAR